MLRLLNTIFFSLWIVPAYGAHHFSKVQIGGSFQKTEYKNQVFKGIVFRNVNFSRGQFSGSTFENVQFIDCDLGGASFHHAKLSNVHFLRTRGPKSSFWDAKLFNVNFEESHFPFLDMSQVELQNVTFKKTTLSHSNFSYSHLFNVNIIASEVFQIIIVNSSAWSVIINETPIEESPYSYISPPFRFERKGIFNAWSLGIERAQIPVEWMSQYKFTGLRIMDAAEPSGKCIEDYPSIDLLGERGNRVFSLVDSRDIHPCYSLCTNILKIKLRFNLHQYPEEMKSRLVVWLRLDEEHTKLESIPKMKRMGQEYTFRLNHVEDREITLSSDKNIAVCEIKLQEEVP
jgi:hypothetical protein